MCICLQIIPEQVSFDGEISECEDTSQHSNISNTMNSEESFDRLIPFHTLLDVSPNRSKAELAHKGALSQRQRPSADALRTAILRRTVSATSNVSQKYILIHVPELLLNCLHVKLLRSGLCFSRLQVYEGENVKSFTTFIAMQPLVPDHACMPHMKAIHVPFNWMYSSLICNQRLQSDRPKY